MAEYPYPSDRIVTVFGGSGFVGRQIVRAFSRAGWRVRAAMRRPDHAGFLQPSGTVGQIQSVQANLRYPYSLAAAVEGAEIVVNAAGIKSQQARQNYEAVHVFGASEVARVAREAGARAFVHLSGIGADSGSANAYVASKGRGEEATREMFPDATILRPSVVFGPGDDFLSRFAALARAMPALPLFGGGDAKLQPVFVGDVALAATRAIDGIAKPGATYELGGPEVMTLREAVELVLRVVERRRLLVPLPFGASRMLAQATEIASGASFGLFPAALTTTRDQVELLRADNIVSSGAVAAGLTLAGLKIEAQGAEAIAPGYLTRYRKTGQFAPSRFA
jgi:uncharacterized protein YbjT (DUF2867 family)